MDYFSWNVSPVLLELGPLQLRWYGILFVGSFFLGLMISKWIFQREGRNPEILDTLLIYALIGTVIGARLMHCLAYQPQYYLSHPLEILMVWKGGLASHGGLLGVIIAFWLFCKRYKESFFWLISRMTIPGLVIAAAVRFGNFFNSEILGKETDLPWAIIFERVDMLPRHPVQLYEAFSYLAIFGLFIILYKKLSSGLITRLFPGLLLSTMFTVRFLLEYTKTKQADYSWDIPLSTGQMLSLPFIIIGIVWVVWAIKGHQVNKA
ncbi:prolipoprotein diacylglyceryl transferase [Sulfurovum sp. zt1-1]|uniref:Phosphatidylglycerol--prolipoprotein diacylglyceryl transferase n=1 Tax=Sulfurovum zhangzhouensis TaxID=3019067 RepID=A0ABT7QX56_9BACT|nr:prolipoprotein diacylglyceryl transferase [Sulfurovum zhangzhouensis]MDM5271372.1 prolipoprotein diacylglyceryl transferase [Sulfurovum zhangzhouensis]